MKYYEYDSLHSFADSGWPDTYHAINHFGNSEEDDEWDELQREDELAHWPYHYSD